MSAVVILGGTRGLGRELAVRLADLGAEVIISGRNLNESEAIAAQMNGALRSEAGSVRGISADLSDPSSLNSALSTVGAVQHLIIAGALRDQNTVREFNIDRAINLAILKMVGYTTAVSVLRDRIDAGGSVLLFGGMAKDYPYPGSTTVTSVNAGVVGIVNTLKHEMKPIRVNSIHPGLVGDSPYWASNTSMLEFARNLTLTARLTRTDDIVEGCLFLLNNPAANGINLDLDGGRV